ISREKIISWDVVNRKVLDDHTFQESSARTEVSAVGTNDRVNSVASSPDRGLAAIATPNGVVLWNVADRRLVEEPLAKQAVQNVAFSRDGKVLARNEGATIFLWDVANHKALGDPFTMAKGRVDGIAVNPDGSLLAIANSNRVLLWDVAAGAPLGEPLPSAARVMVFSPDGRLLVTAASPRGSPTIWDVDVESWRSRACAIASRNLSPAEWKEI